MRKTLALLFGLTALAGPMLVTSAYAASQDEEEARGRAQADAEKRKKQKEKEWDTSQADLPSVKNAGPCPFVKVLYDAARYQEFKEGRETPAATGFTGEIGDIAAACQYKGTEPIKVQVAIRFDLGRGAAADGRSKDYRYWVAVTRRNASVIARQEFAVKGDFPAGKDRISVTDKVDGIVIPRGDSGTSGENFEILVGFDVTPQMAEFNRLGKRFRVNAVAPAAVAQASPSGTTAAK
jgi:hypothetical protein